MTINQIIKNGFDQILKEGECNYSKHIVMDMLEALDRLGIDLEGE